MGELYAFSTTLDPPTKVGGTVNEAPSISRVEPPVIVKEVEVSRKEEGVNVDEGVQPTRDAHTASACKQTHQSDVHRGHSRPRRAVDNVYHKRYGVW